MVWNNSGKTNNPDIETEDEMYKENAFSGWQKDKRLGLFSDIISSPFVWGGTAVVVLILMFMIFWPDSNSKASIDKLDNIAQRLDMLENRIFIVETNLQNISIQQPQELNMESFQNRIEQLEAFVKHKTDQFTSELEKAQKKISSLESKPSSTVVASKPSSAPKPVPASIKPAASRKADTSQYHIVKKGETLYRISVNYGIPVDKLLELNDMTKDSVIQPGQKILVSR
jgi:LysM repeat protein